MWITISIECSRRDLFIDMVVGRFIFKSNQITLSPCVTFIPTTGVGKRVRFYCALSNMQSCRLYELRLGLSLLLCSNDRGNRVLPYKCVWSSKRCVHPSEHCSSKAEWLWAVKPDSAEMEHVSWLFYQMDAGACAAVLSAATRKMDLLTQLGWDDHRARKLRSSRAPEVVHP